MPLLKANRFTSYELTGEEFIVAQTFNELQLCHIQNEIAVCAEEKVNLKYDPEHPQAFMQEEAELQGKINALSYLITCHEAAQSEYMRLQLQAAQKQAD